MEDMAYSKLATIKTIEKLIKLRKINPTSEQYELKPSDFAMIEGLLSRENLT
jgi:hypothetical protein